jgi:lysyl-tRNA synthetase class 2
VSADDRGLARRAEVLGSVRAFFGSRGFREVETPILVPSPGLDVHLEAFAVAGTRAPRWLSTSPEYQMKRLLAQGQSRIFQITRAFRQDELGERHHPEFTMLEWYRADADMDAVVRDTEQLIARVTAGEVRLGSGGSSGENGGGQRRIDTRPPFERLGVCAAFARFAGIGEDETLRLAAEDEDRFFRVLVDQVEPGIAALDHAVVLTDYPAVQASLARKKPDDPRLAERFEVYVAGVELCNGFGELTDPVEQRARFVADQAERTRRGLPVYPIDERFLEALERGLPPSGGNALGLDRLVALTLGTTEIARGMAFTDANL